MQEISLCINIKSNLIVFHAMDKKRLNTIFPCDCASVCACVCVHFVAYMEMLCRDFDVVIYVSSENE